MTTAFLLAPLAALPVAWVGWWLLVIVNGNDTPRPVEVVFSEALWLSGWVAAIAAVSLLLVGGVVVIRASRCGAAPSQTTALALGGGSAFLLWMAFALPGLAADGSFKMEEVNRVLLIFLVSMIGSGMAVGGTFRFLLFGRR